jgi:hypothetical protein
MGRGVWGPPFSCAGFTENKNPRPSGEAAAIHSSAGLQAVHPGRIIMQNHTTDLLRLLLNDQPQSYGIPQSLLEGDLGGFSRQPSDFRAVVPAAPYHQLGKRCYANELPIAFGHAQRDPGGRPTHVDPNMREGVGKFSRVLDPGKTPVK